jgi:hypothetical protein
VTPVLTLEEALDFHKNLNKSVLLSSSNSKKLDNLKQIEEFFFPDIKRLVIIDLNAKVYERNYSKTAKKDPSPKF